jgi:hypothetical protein
MITACSNKESQKQLFEATIVKKCIEHLHSNGSERTYLISPKYDNFEFNAFFRQNNVIERYNKEYDYDQKKKMTLDCIGWTNQDFSETQTEVNKKYLNKTNPELIKLSNSKDSETVYFFSGIHENLVFISTIIYCDTISACNLSASSFKRDQPFIAAGSIIFTLKNGEIEDVILDSGISLCYQCP